MRAVGAFFVRDALVFGVYSSHQRGTFHFTSNEHAVAIVVEPIEVTWLAGPISIELSADDAPIAIRVHVTERELIEFVALRHGRSGRNECYSPNKGN